MATTIWKGQLAFGLVSLPVRLSVAARGESISFNQLDKRDHARVKQVLHSTKDDRILPKEEIVKGFEYEKGKYVVIDEADIKAVAPKTAGVMEILEFVKDDSVDPVYLESSYYMAAEEGGAKPYALLFEGMRASGYCAIAKIAMHSREHIVIIRPGKRGMMLHTMFYPDEVRAADEFNSDASLLNEKELKLAGMLIESLAAEFDPRKYSDTYKANLRAMIEAKVEGRAVVATPDGPRREVINIMDALERSLQKKPAVVEKQKSVHGEVPKRKQKRA